jgi:catecholate siderophore receptor
LTPPSCAGDKTISAKAGAQVGQVPHHTISIWNHYKFHPRAAAALGLVGRSRMFATIDNTMTLPGYFRADAALFIDLAENVRLQANLENVLNRKYYANADSNTNVSPGSPRAVRVALVTRF